MARLTALVCWPSQLAYNTDLQRASSGANVPRISNLVRISPVQATKSLQGRKHHLELRLRTDAPHERGQPFHSSQWAMTLSSQLIRDSCDIATIDAAPVARRSGFVPSLEAMPGRHLAPVGDSVALRQQPRHCSNRQKQHKWTARQSINSFEHLKCRQCFLTQTALCAWPANKEVAGHNSRLLPTPPAKQRARSTVADLTILFELGLGDADGNTRQHKQKDC